MTDKYISSVHIQKLGHNLLEIRERALHSIISKLNYGFVYDNDLARSKEILSRLFDWFLFDQCTCEDEVLSLINRILNTESGRILLNHYGTDAVISELQKIRNYIEPKFHAQIDDIIRSIREHIVPPLQSNLPLSYRSDQSTVNGPGTTATAIEGFIRFNVTPEQGNGVDDSFFPINIPSSSESVKNDSVSERSGLLNYVFKWQPLIAPDRHVIQSIEDSLRNPTEPSALLHSCEFFSDVMLQDFPAEVFVQRPSIIFLFKDLLKSCNSTRIVSAVLSSLLKLTNCLCTRVHYYNDPCTYSNKQITIATWNSRNSTPIDPQTNSKTSFSSDDINEVENVEILMSKQMPLPDYCFMLMISVLEYLKDKPVNIRQNTLKFARKQNCINTAIDLLEKLLRLLCLSVTNKIWEDSEDNAVAPTQAGFRELLSTFGNVLEFNRLEATTNDSEPLYGSIDLRLTHLCTTLLKKLVPVNRGNSVMPNNLKIALSNTLLNPILLRLYPALHSSVLDYVETFYGASISATLQNYKNLSAVCKSITHAVKFLKHNKDHSAIESVDIAKEAVLCLEVHKNLSFVKAYVELCSMRLPSVIDNADVMNKVNEITLSLLAHNQLQVREETYHLCQTKVIEAIGPKLNETKVGIPSSQILFLLQHQVLTEMAEHGMCNDSIKIQGYAETVLLHILKCKILVTDKVWNKVVEALIPSLPVLLCHTNRVTSLGRTLLGMLDPDNAKSLYLTDLQVIKGNIEILFSTDSHARNEAVSRLCWTLASQENSSVFLPRLNNLHDKMLASVCQITRPFDLNRNRNTQHFYQPSNLQQVLDLLKSPKVEPVIRRSALTQVSVMMEDYLLHSVFIQNKGVQLVLNVIRIALTEMDYSEYPDSVIPAVSILKNICLYSASVRQELSNNKEVFYLILRAGFLFLTEERLKEDVSTLLFLLIFVDFLQGCPSDGNLSVSALVLKKLNPPFICRSCNESSRFTKEEIAESLYSDSLCLSSLQIHWTTEWCGSISKVIQRHEISSLIPGNYDERLKITEYALTLLKKASLEFCVKKYLNEIQNSTSHLVAIENINNLAGFVQLFIMIRESYNWKIEEFCALQWETTFSRFLRVPPSGEDDTLLLMCVLKFLLLLVPLYKNADNSCWIVNILKDSNSAIMDLLETSGTPESPLKELIQELLRLIIICTCEEQQSSIRYVPLQKRDKMQWSNVIQVISDSLKFNDAQHFYNLAYLDCLLSALMYLTGSLGWSKCKSGIPPREPLPQLICGLCELVSAFHCGKGAAATMSLMGLSITRNIILILNHLSAEMQHHNAKNWELCFFDEIENENVFIILHELWYTRDTVLKAAVIQLFSGLCTKPRAALEIVKEIGKCKIGIWQAALNVLLDEDEPSIVRENAAALLANLSSHMTNVNTDILFITNPNDIDTYKYDDIVGFVIEILENHNFFKEIENIVTNLYIKEVLNPLLEDFKQQSAGGAYVSPSSSGSYSGKPSVIVTPGLIKSVAIFINNILTFCGGRMTNSLQEHGLIRLFFRCLTRPNAKLGSSKRMSLYTDILEMDTAICMLLNRAVCTNLLLSGTILHTRDCLNVMLSLINPGICCTNIPEFIYLRNRLWCEIFRLMITLTECDGDDSASIDSRAQESLSVISECLNESGKEHFVEGLCEAIITDTSDELQLCALSSLTSLLRVDTVACFNTPVDNFESTSMRSILDSMRTPHSVHLQNSAETNRSNKSKSSEKTVTELLGNLYFSKNPTSHEDYSSRFSSDDERDLMAGAEICKLLLHLYDISALKNATVNVKKRSVIINALTATLSVSKEAKKYALRNGLLEIVFQQLKETYIKLSLESVECLRRIADKKRVCPLLKELDSLVGLLTNFMLGDVDVKTSVSLLGLSDLIHKLWVWFSVQKVYLTNALKLLCTFTTNCNIAAHSLILTSPVAGTGPRKSPTNFSLLHAIVLLISKEMDQISRTHDLTVLHLSFQVLHNSCEVTECRIVLAKSNLLSCISRLHPAITKHQKPWESVELIWLEFLYTLTGYSEGQSKASDLLELLLILTSGSRLSNRQTALLVLRNIAFHPSNRPRLLTSGDFLNVLHSKLSSGTSDEVNSVVAIMWTLAANNQKAKLVFKCARLDEKLHEAIRKYHLLPDNGVQSADIEKMRLVYNMLRDGDRS